MAEYRDSLSALVLRQISHSGQVPVAVVFGAARPSIADGRTPTPQRPAPALTLRSRLLRQAESPSHRAGYVSAQSPQLRQHGSRPRGDSSLPIKVGGRAGKPGQRPDILTTRVGKPVTSEVSGRAALMTWFSFMWRIIFANFKFL